MTGGNAAVAPGEQDFSEITNLDQIPPLQTEQMIATRIDYNEEENSGPQNEEEEDEVDNEQHTLPVRSFRTPPFFQFLLKFKQFNVSMYSEIKA